MSAAMAVMPGTTATPITTIRIPRRIHNFRPPTTVGPVTYIPTPSGTNGAGGLGGVGGATYRPNNGFTVMRATSTGVVFRAAKQPVGLAF
jgi:hypothetical protein